MCSFHDLHCAQACLFAKKTFFFSKIAQIQYMFYNTSTHLIARTSCSVCDKCIRKIHKMIKSFKFTLGLERSLEFILQYWYCICTSFLTLSGKIPFCG